MSNVMTQLLSRRPLWPRAAHRGCRVPSQVSRLDTLGVLADDLSCNCVARASAKLLRSSCTLLLCWPGSVLIAPELRQGDDDNDLEPADDGHLAGGCCKAKRIREAFQNSASAAAAPVWLPSGGLRSPWGSG